MRQLVSDNANAQRTSHKKPHGKYVKVANGKWQVSDGDGDGDGDGDK